METEKRCVICGVVIANMWQSDWYRYIRVKYCPTCREAVKRSQTAASKRRTRKLVREAKREARAAAVAARTENEQLRTLLRENAQMRRMLGEEKDHD